MSADPPFTDEQETLRESVRRFVANELRPHASEWEDARWFPDEVFGALARVGFLGLKYPEEYGGEGGDYVTAVKTTAQGGHHGLSFLIVDAGEGVSASKLDKLGWHASDTATVAFQDTFVAEENLLGEEHEGFRLIMANFQWERLLMALGAVGAMGVALERTIAYSRERQAFGRPLTGRQAVRHRLVELATTAHTCRCVTYDALRRFVAGDDAVRQLDDGQARHPARCLRGDGRLPAAARRSGYMREYEIRAHTAAKAVGRAWRATRGSGPSGAAPTRS
jgi:alkylation response protein AidB-like acyl-CoA dehydrogenase